MAPSQTADDDRRRLGAWYTPPQLVEHVLDMALGGDAATADRFGSALDPACGDGRFLAAVRRRLGPSVRLTGCDLDPGAVDASRATLGDDAELLAGDALERDWSGRSYDLVIGNPPFLNRLARLTARGHRSRWGGGPYADAAAEFLALAVTVARPVGGRVALILPHSVLTARDAEPIRRAVAERAALTHLWWSDTPMFDAHVRTAVLVFETGATQGLVTRSYGADVVPAQPVTLTTSWGALLLDPAEHSIDTAPMSGRALGELARFTVGFRDQYYGLVGAVGDDVDGPPLVTSGLIEPGRCLWGERPVRFAGQRFLAPRVDLSKLQPPIRRWVETQLVPKVLIANQTRTIEAVVDRAGAWVPGVPVISATAPQGTSPHDRDALVEQVAAVLGSAAATTWVRHHAAGSGLSADTVRVSPRLLASIPVPDAVTDEG